MKKELSLVLAVAISGSVLVGCSAKDKGAEKEVEKIEGDAKVEDVKETKEVAEGEMAKIGLGVITSIDKSKDLEGDKAPVGQVDTNIAAVGFDKDGKVVKVVLDSAQSKIEFDKDLQLVTDVKEKGKTKVELGAGYGMIKASEIGKEWDEQIFALGDWMVGKTVDEIKSLKVKEKDENHKAVPDDAELSSSVTITVDGYIAAVEQAYANAKDINGGAVELGLGTDISHAKSKALGEKDGKEILPVAQVDAVITVGAFDKDGKVVSTIIDNAQTKIEFDKDGKVTTDKNAKLKSKLELGADYGMAKASGIGKEWNEQVEALGQWMEGKSIDEITSMKVKEKDEAHPAVPEEAELTSSVTISVEGYLNTIKEAKENSK